MPRKKPRLERVAMGSAIFLWRRVRELAQQELAEKCGWPKGRVSKYETGSQWPDDETVQRIATVVGIERETLYHTQAVLFDLLRSYQVEVGDEAGPGEALGSDSALPPNLQRRWADLLRAEAELARRRLEIEWETRVAAAREASGDRP